MKKIILSLLFTVFFAGSSLLAQPKVNLFLTNPGLSSGFWKIDLMVTVLAGQTWRVGSSNIRVGWISLPPASVSVKPDNPVINPNPNLHSNSNYSAMTTTSITGGTAISLNISRLNNCHLLVPGTYKLGELRFNRLDTTGCVRLTILPNSVLQDSITQLQTVTGWTATVDTTCRRIDFLTGISVNEELPTVFKLYNNYPNPFNPATTIKYDIPKNAYVQITVFDVIGREVEMLVNQNMVPGRYELVWDAKSYASGTYLYKIEAGDFVDIKKMVLVK